ncbi:MAG: dihydroneopterin aldolase [Bacteroidia bacterium]|jgi:dihydroneopterin aldolase
MNSTSAVLKINDLRIFANHGWYEKERVIGAVYRIDVAMGLNLPNTSLQLQDTIDYQVVVDLITEVMKQEFKLIEDSCRSIYNQLNQHIEKIASLEVTVTKLDIPINNLHSTSFTLKSI